jgi:hypothetical protein
MSGLRTAGARFFEIPKSEIRLGTLPEFEYGMLRLALQLAVRHATEAANALKSSGDPKLVAKRNLYLDQATEFRALQRRFICEGRRGVSA